MKNLFIIFSLFLLSFPCMSQDQNQGVSQQNKEMVAAYAQCKAGLDTDHRLDAIRAKLPIPVTSATLAQRGNTRRPNKAEREAIDAFDELMGICWQEYKNINAKYGDADGVAIIARNSEKFRNRLARLRSGQWTYGEYISNEIEAVAREVEAIVAQYNDEQRAKAAQDAAAKQAADARILQQLLEMKRANDAETAQLQLQMQMLEAQQQAARSSQLLDLSRQFMQMGQPRYLAPQPVPQFPVRTNCTRYGNNIDCVSQ